MPILNAIVPTSYSGSSPIMSSTGASSGAEQPANHIPSVEADIKIENAESFFQVTIVKGTSFFRIDPLSKPSDFSTLEHITLSTLENIAQIVTTKKFEYAFPHRDRDPFSQGSQEELYRTLRRIAAHLYGEYRKKYNENRKTKTSNHITRKLFTKKDAIRRVYAMICPNQLDVLDPMSFQKVASFLKRSDLIMLSKVSRQENAWVKDAIIWKAREFGYVGQQDCIKAKAQDYTKAQEWLRCLFAEITTLAQRGFIPQQSLARLKNGKFDPEQIIYNLRSLLKADPNAYQTVLDNAVKNKSVLAARVLLVIETNMHLKQVEECAEMDLKQREERLKAVVNVPSRTGLSPLLLSIITLRDTKKINLFIRSGAGLDYQTTAPFPICGDSLNEIPTGSTALHCAVEIGNLEVVQALLQAGADKNLQNANRDTPLNLAAWLKGREEIVGELIKYKADLDKPDKYGVTPLMTSIIKGHREKINLLVQSLIRSGGGLNHKTTAPFSYGDINIPAGSTALHCAVRIGDLATVELLLSNWANPNHKDANDNTPLHLATATQLEKRTKTIAALVAYEADVNALNNASLTPLITNILQGDQETINLLMQSRVLLKGLNNKTTAPLLSKDGIKIPTGSTALHCAVIVGSLEVVQALLQAGADKNSQDALGQTPLNLAAWLERREKISEALIKHGADHKPDRDGVTPLISSILGGNQETINLLIESLIRSGGGLNHKTIAPFSCSNSELPAGSTALHCAVRLGNLEAVTVLLQNWANPNHKNAKGETPLHLAAWLKGREEIMEELIKYKADANMEDIDGLTPLILSIMYTSEIKKIELLMKAGAELNYQTPVSFKTNVRTIPAGSTALHCAARVGSLEVVTVLLQGLAKPSPQDADGNTPLHVVMENVSLDGRNNQIAQVLVSNNADQNIRNAKGETPLNLLLKKLEKSSVTISL